jgi:hypothetical protein
MKGVLESASVVVTLAAVSFGFTSLPTLADDLPPQMMQHIPVQKLQQIERDLSHNSSQNFLRQGQERLEHEIKLLTRTPLGSGENLLKIEEQLLNQQNPQEQEH